MTDFENKPQDLIPTGFKDSVWRFFVAFSRFEYALKRLVSWTRI
jgi:hypothetical protein